MVKSTTIVRASDALPLAASVDDEQVRISLYSASHSLSNACFIIQTEQALQEHKQQAKLIFRRISPNSEPLCSIESGPFTLQYVPFYLLPNHVTSQYLVCSYLISNNVVYLTIADKSYPRKLAFSYLDELSKEFQNSYGAKVDTVRKPYAFVGFGELETRKDDPNSDITLRYVHV